MSMNQQDGSSRPTVVLVHGAFADGSSWNEVIERLQAEGIQVTVPPNPLRGISIDSAYIASLLDQIPGPVLAVFYLALIGSALPFTLYFTLLKRLKATDLSLINYAVPVVAVIVGALFLREPVTLRMVAGAVLVIVGVAVAGRAKEKPA